MFNKILSVKVDISPIITFRILFGATIFFALVRNLISGNVSKFYIEPQFYFPLYGFEWVVPLGETGTYLAYILMMLSSVGILFGAFYRFSTTIFFVFFSYFEFLDLTHYLNHYYMISLIALLMCFVPANGKFSFDAIFFPKTRRNFVPRWTIFIFQFQIAILYFYAGIAKLHYDWLFDTQPLKMWLAGKSDLAIIGKALSLPLTAYIFAWAGTLFDLSIAFLLWNKKYRIPAYISVVFFHLMTAIIFNIGIFPILMIALTTIFFSEFWHKRIISKFATVFILTLSKLKQAYIEKTSISTTNSVKVPWFIWIYMAIQILLPLRHYLYPGNVLWTEEGFRFSWKVMIVEKRGQAVFKVKDSESDFETEIDNRKYLTEKQEVFMSYQPDMILHYAHFLAHEFQKKGIKNPIVTVDCFVSLNGRVSRRFIDPEVNLAKIRKGILHKPWILENKDL